MEPLSITLTAQAGDKAVDLLAANCELPKSRIKDAMTKGAVWLTRGKRTRRLRRATTELLAGDTLALYYDESILASTPPAPTLVDQQATYSVWYKPAGLMSSGSRYGDHHAIDRYLGKASGKEVYLVHRLDRFTRGLMVLATSGRSAANLSAQFQARTVEKAYQAIVQGAISESFSIDTPLDGKSAVSHVRPLANQSELTLVEVAIETGRKHQVRQHLAMAGYPVLGDRQYGDSNYPELQLVSVVLGFDCPDTGERRRYELDDSLKPDLSAIRPRN